MSCMIYIFLPNIFQKVIGSFDTIRINILMHDDIRLRIEICKARQDKHQKVGLENDN